jgi:hypothetical protein
MKPDRAVVTWEGPGEPIMLTLYGPDGEMAVPLLPKRALTLAQELLTRGVQAIKPRLRRAADCASPPVYALPRICLTASSVDHRALAM